MARFIDIRHPFYTKRHGDWCKYRTVYESGQCMISKYLQRFSKREEEVDFEARRALTYVDNQAKAVLHEIKDSIHHRFTDITRTGGPDSYRHACTGLDVFVDKERSSMNMFMGTKVLKELLLMGRVGILTDAPTNRGATLRDKDKKTPFLTVYPAEDICSWSFDEYNELRAVLLSECVESEDNGLITGISTRYRYMARTNDGVVVRILNDKDEVSEQYTLDLDRIPFTCVELNDSLFKDVADAQITIMNLESADNIFAFKANFPIYYEFTNNKITPKFNKPAAAGGKDDGEPVEAKDNSINLGGAFTGRQFPTDANAPGFINPDPDTLRVSMEKGQQIKDSIRRMVNLNLVESTRNRQSAESKNVDKQGLDASLSYIGLVMERAERDIAYHWASFEGEKKPTDVLYPKNYTLKTDEERIEMAKELDELSRKIASNTYKKEAMKEMVRVTLGPKVGNKAMDAILSEIDKAEVLVTDPDVIIESFKEGLADGETSSLAIGYPAGTAKKAQKEMIKRVKATLDAQGGQVNPARGAKVPGGTTSSQEKAGKPKRGKSDSVSNS